MHISLYWLIIYLLTEWPGRWDHHQARSPQSPESLYEQLRPLLLNKKMLLRLPLYEPQSQIRLSSYIESGKKLQIKLHAVKFFNFCWIFL